VLVALTTVPKRLLVAQPLHRTQVIVGSSSQSNFRYRVIIGKAGGEAKADESEVGWARPLAIVRGTHTRNGGLFSRKR
jgi:hypothetical protein